MNHVIRVYHIISLITSSPTDTSAISYCVHWVHHMTCVIWLKIQLLRMFTNYAAKQWNTIINRCYGA